DATRPTRRTGIDAGPIRGARIRHGGPVAHRARPRLPRGARLAFRTGHLPCAPVDEEGRSLASIEEAPGVRQAPSGPSPMAGNAAPSVRPTGGMIFERPFAGGYRVQGYYPL